MRFNNYKACVTLDESRMLCFNKRTKQIEILDVVAKPANIEEVPEKDLVRLKAQLDSLNSKAHPVAPTAYSIAQKPTPTETDNDPKLTLREYLNLYAVAEEMSNEHTPNP